MKLEDLEVAVCEACGFESDDLYGGLCLNCRDEKKREEIHNNEGAITIPDSQSDISERPHSVKSSTGEITDREEERDG